MRPEQYGSQAVADLLKRKKVATLADLKTALGTPSRMTVFRKLAALGYRTSYSHRGKFYTLETLPRFDSQGIWSHGDMTLHGKVDIPEEANLPWGVQDVQTDEEEKSKTIHG